MAKRVKVRRARLSDAGEIAQIYNEGIEDRIATFETEKRDKKERTAWLREHGKEHPVLVVEDPDGSVAGWASITAVSDRCVYSGVGEYSVYVKRGRRGAGVGSLLLKGLLKSAADEGYWKLIGRMFSFNKGSIRLSQMLGFREVGVLEKHGKLDGKWLDVVEVEKLIPENLK